MRSYQQYQLEDLVLDQRFRQWVNCPSAEENANWEQWLKQYPDKRDVVEQAKAVVLSLYGVKNEVLSEEEIQHEIQEVLAQLEALSTEEKKDKQTFLHQTSLWIKIAASVLIILSAGWLYKAATSQSHKKQLAAKQENTQSDNLLVEHINDTNKPMLVNLPDGSTIILKQNSSISHPKLFNDQTREITLNGEAFFEVTKNPSKPFYVYTNELVAKVLGTSFHIKARPTDKQVTITVRTGKVSVYKNLAGQTDVKKEASRLTLTSNQQAVYGRENKQLALTVFHQPDTDNLIMPNTHFIFKNTAVTEAFAALERAYGIDIRYNPKFIEHCTITASLTDEPLLVKLDLICRAVGVTYQLTGTQAVVTGQGCLQ